MQLGDDIQDKKAPSILIHFCGLSFTTSALQISQVKPVANGNHNLQEEEAWKDFYCYLSSFRI